MQYFTIVLITLAEPRLPRLRELAREARLRERHGAAMRRQTTQHRAKRDSTITARIPFPHRIRYSRSMREYNRANTPIAKRLRKAMTPWERKLWHRFLKTYPLRWQRQKPVGNYIVDFYCAKAKLVVELDGSGHYTLAQQAHDAARTKVLEAESLLVLRYANNHVDRMFDEVCDEIDRIAVQRSGVR